MLVTGEMWPSKRILSDEGAVVEGEVVMEGVEHLGQYVFEMTKTKMSELGAGKGGAQDRTLHTIKEETFDVGEEAEPAAESAAEDGTEPEDEAG
jgi:intron-binding protein aquarius